MAQENFNATGNLSETYTGFPLANQPIVIQVTNPDGSAGPTLQATTDQSGNFSVSVPAPDPLPAGAYIGDATYAGDADEQAADSGQIVAEVGPASTTLTLAFTVAAAPAPAPAPAS